MIQPLRLFRPSLIHLSYTPISGALSSAYVLHNDPDHYGCSWAPDAPSLTSTIFRLTLVYGHALVLRLDQKSNPEFRIWHRRCFSKELLET